MSCGSGSGNTAVEAMKKYDIKRSSFYKLAKPYEEAKKGKPNE